MNSYQWGKVLSETFLKKFGSKVSNSENDSRIGYLHAICLESLDEYGPARAILEDIVHREHFSTLLGTTSLSSAAKLPLASIYLIEGKTQLAVDILRELIQAMKKSSEPDNLGILTAQHELALALSQDNNNTEAISLLRDVVMARNKILSPTDHNRIVSQHALAVALTRDGNPKEAISLLRDVVQIKSTIYQPAHPYRIISLRELAMAFWMDGNYTEAFEILREIVAIAEREWEPSDTRRKNCESLLERFLAETGRNVDGITGRIKDIQIAEDIENVAGGEGEGMKKWGKKIRGKKWWRKNI